MNSKKSKSPFWGGIGKVAQFLLLAIVALAVVSTGCGEDRTHEYEERTGLDHWMMDVMREEYLWGDVLKDLTWKDYFAKPDEFMAKITAQAPVNDEWSWCAIDTLPKDAAYVQLFRFNGSKWAHTGCYIGGGETVDARGHAYGTIRGKLSGYKWTHWAIPAGMEQDEPAEQTGGDGVIYSAIVTTASGSLNVRSGPGTKYPRTGSLPKGERVDVLMEYDLDGDGTPEWAFIGGDGKQGYVSLAYLTKCDEPPADPEPVPAAEPVTDPDALRWAVFLPCESREAAENMAKAHPGAILTAFKPPDAGG